MASKIIHVGRDTCHRIPVLESAGYDVEACVSVAELHEALANECDFEAVLISEGADGAHVDAVELTRTECLVPIVLFRDTQRTFAESAFDLVVPILAPPQTWLMEMAAVIAHSRAVREESQALRQRSAELRNSTVMLRAKFTGERRRAQKECQKVIPPLDWRMRGPDRGK